MQYPGGEITTYGYDAQGRLELVDPPGSVYQTFTASICQTATRLQIPQPCRGRPPTERRTCPPGTSS